MLQIEGITQGPLSVVFYFPPPKIGCLGQPLVLSPDPFTSIPFPYVACLHVCESFLVMQYNPLVRFDLVCKNKLFV